MPSFAEMFGLDGSEKEPCLGIYIALDSLYVAEAVSTGGRIEVRQLVRVPVPARAETGGTGKLGSLNTDFLAETGRIVDLLRPVLEQGHWGARKVAVTLAPSFGLARYFMMPSVDRRFWKQAVPLEAKKYVPFAFNDLSFDFQVFPNVADKKMGVLFALTPQKNIDSIRAITAALGLQLTAVELVSYSAPRVWLAAGAAQKGVVTAHVHLDPGAVYVVMQKDGVPYITRELHWTGDQFDRRRIDLQGSFEFAKKQLGVQQLTAMVTGSAELIPLQTGLKEDLSMDVGAMSLSDAGLPTTEWSVLAAVGASLRPAKAGSVTLDISQSFRKQFEDLRVLRALTVGVGSVVALCLVGAIYNEIAIVASLSSLASLRKKTNNFPALASMSADQIDGFIKGMRSESDNIDNLMSRREFATKWWALLPETIPDNVWLESLNYKIEMDDQPQRHLTMAGFSYASDKNADVASAKQFLENLKQNKEFFRLFPECLPSFEGANNVERPERRTPFSVACEKKPPKV
jgi:Tfp pilus assembly PilM family ATPase